MKIIIYKCDYCPRTGEDLIVTEYCGKDLCYKCLQYVKSEIEKAQDKK